MVPITLLRRGRLQSPCRAPKGLPAGGSPHIPHFPKKKLCSTPMAAHIFFLPQYKETVYLERSRNQKHREKVFLLGGQQSMPGLAGVLLQRCRECRELDAASLLLPQPSQRSSKSHQLFQTMTNLFPGVAFPYDSSRCAVGWDAVPGGHAHVLDSALQREFP